MLNQFDHSVDSKFWKDVILYSGLFNHCIIITVIIVQLLLMYLEKVEEIN